MPRNLYERVEVLFPVKDPGQRERICTEILASYLADTRKARILGPGGTYRRPRAVRNGHGFCAQEHLMRLSKSAGDAQRNAALSVPAEVYTSNGVRPNITSPEPPTTERSPSQST